MPAILVGLNLKHERPVTAVQARCPG
jgi:hypothetical protein